MVKAVNALEDNNNFQHSPDVGRPEPPSRAPGRTLSSYPQSYPLIHTINKESSKEKRRMMTFSLNFKSNQFGQRKVGDYNDDPNLGLDPRDVITVREALEVEKPPESTKK